MLSRDRERKKIRTGWEIDREMYFHKNGLSGVEVKKEEEKKGPILL